MGTVTNPNRNFPSAGSVSQILKEYIFCVTRQKNPQVASARIDFCLPSTIWWCENAIGLIVWKKNNQKNWVLCPSIGSCLKGVFEVSCCRTKQESYLTESSLFTRWPQCSRSLMFIIMHPHSQEIPLSDFAAADACFYREEFWTIKFEKLQRLWKFESIAFPPLYWI